MRNDDATIHQSPIRGRIESLKQHNCFHYQYCIARGLLNYPITLVYAVVDMFSSRRQQSKTRSSFDTESLRLFLGSKIFRKLKSHVFITIYEGAFLGIAYVFADLLEYMHARVQFVRLSEGKLRFLYRRTWPVVVSNLDFKEFYSKLRNSRNIARRKRFQFMIFFV